MKSSKRERMKSLKQRKILSVFLILIFLSGSIFPFGARNVFAQPQAGMSLPVASAPLGLTAAFTPVLLSGVKVDPEKPFHFEFILNRGDTNLQGDALRPEADKLIKYFMAALTIPEKNIWVNLSPYEANRVVPEVLGVTDMGRDLLAQDYILKQLTASLVNPEGEWGKKFWDAVYKKAYAQFGTTNIPVDTLNKVWIMPSKAVVIEAPEGASIKESRLKVMLEEDYVALQAKQRVDSREYSVSSKDQPLNTNDQRLTAQSSLASQIVREIVVPLLEKEVNEGEHFASLRQIYSAIILAAWYKTALKDAVLNRVYSNQDKVRGIDIADKEAAKKIYDQYVEAFKKGVSSMIKVEYDPLMKKNVSRKYFSGGITKFGDLTDSANPLLQIVRGKIPPGLTVSVDLVNPGTKISSGLITDQLSFDTFNEIVGLIPGAKVLGVKAVVYLDDEGNAQTVFFPINIRHQEIIQRFPNIKPPYENIFGFELQIDPATKNVLGIQLNWSQARNQETTFEKIDRATESLRKQILLPLRNNLVRVNNAITYVQETMVKHNVEGHEIVYRGMSTELETKYFSENPDASARMVNELMDLLPYDPNSLADQDKISRVVNHYAALALAYEMKSEEKDTLLIESVLDLLSGIKSLSDEEKDRVDEINDSLLDSFLTHSFINDLRVVADRSLTLAPSGVRPAGISTQQEMDNFANLIHDAMGAIAVARLELATGEYRKKSPRDTIKRICTEALAQKFSGDFNGMVDLTRGEAIFIPRLKDGIPKEEFARFVLRRKGPFVVFRIKAARMGERISLKSIEPMVILKFERAGEILPEGEEEEIKKAVQDAERHLRANMFLDVRWEQLSSFKASIVDNPEIQAFALKGNLTITVEWLTSDRTDIPPIEPFFRKAFDNIEMIIAKEQPAKIPSEDQISAPTVSSDVVGGIDFDTQDFLETVRREGARAIVFSDAFLSQKIDGLTPVISQIID